MIEVTNAKVAVAKEKLKEARTRQKSYADKHRRALEFQPDSLEEPSRAGSHLGNRGVYLDFLSSFPSMIWYVPFQLYHVSNSRTNYSFKRGRVVKPT
uniref:Putative nucleotidyltransferase, ribonuclease H n=1 Tax=Tanacetum cinerariifolium TaxID=118510 RepID=A0A699RRF2_TANCI|nr:putative nucleotidyltransferase, ribonuclease H [Tanacetum cinerariifolium]